MKNRKRFLSLALMSAVLSTSVLTGFASDGDSGEIPTLTWYLPGNPTNMTSDGYNAVMEEVNKYLEEKIGCHLDVKLFAFSEYAQKCSTVISAGEPYDLMFTCDWLNNFATNAGSNAYLPLNDLLEENAPDAMADIPEYMWKATTINGNIYAMPALQTYAKNDGIFLRADIAEELGFKKSSVSVAMKNLREKNHITVTKEGFIYLTDTGRQIAEMIYERHELISGWLIQLGVDPETAVSDACRMEHVISPESFAAIKKHVLENRDKQ